jgi:hypothetical protein
MVLICLLLFNTMAIQSHFGHAHVYSRAEAGFCVSECQNPGHHKLYPDCKGFPLNLTLGIGAERAETSWMLPAYSSELIFQVITTISKLQLSKDHSRAPPAC